MEKILKEKLWDYIIHNNPDLMFILQEKYGVADYLNEKVNGVLALVDELLSDSIPEEIIEEICLNVLTEDLKPSRFIYLRSLLSDEFKEVCNQFSEAGSLTSEVINLLGTCKQIFEIIGFTKDRENDRGLRTALINHITDYLSKH